MKSMPPDLAIPFSGPDERLRARQTLIERAAKLAALESLASTPAHQWTEEQRGFFRPDLNGFPDPPPDRLERWVAVFGDELSMFDDIVQRSAPLSDIELREAVYLAGRLLAPVLGVHLDEVDATSVPWA